MANESNQDTQPVNTVSGGTAQTQTQPKPQGFTTVNSNNGAQQLGAGEVKNSGDRIVIDPRGEFTGDQENEGKLLAYYLDISNPVYERQTNKVVRVVDGKEIQVEESKNVIKEYQYNAVDGVQLKDYIANKFGGVYELDTVNNQIIKIQKPEPKVV